LDVEKVTLEDFLHPLLGSYIASPQWIKSSVGRIYSWVPLSVRRGRRYQNFSEEAQIFDQGKLDQLRFSKLAATLRWALLTVPAYRQYRHFLSQLDRPYEVLRELPLVSKHDIVRNLSDFVSDEAPAGAALKTFTGGSTAVPMMFYLQKGVSRTKEYAFMESFHQRVGLVQSDVVLALRGRGVPSASRPGGRLWMFEPIKQQLILSSDHLERTYMPQYLDALRAWKPRYIQAFPSAIYPLARWLKEHPAPDISERIKGILLYSENVFDYHMALIKEVFSCPVLKHYGHSERVLMAASLPDDERCFFWPQYGHFELVDESGSPITVPGVLGEIVGTGFDNHVMPFVRYRTGDMAMLSAKPNPVLPGYPVVERIEGRRQEFIVCRDHRLISINSLSAAHTADLALSRVDSLQYEQMRPGHFLIKVVTSLPLSPRARTRIARTLEAKTQGGCTAEVAEVNEIPRTASGKHQMLVQHLDISRYLGASESR
jgi:phenylacetate-CoA ligase